MNPLLLVVINALCAGVLAATGEMSWWRTPLWLAVGIVVGAVVAFFDGYIVYNAHPAAQYPAALLTLIISAVIGFALQRARPYILGG